MGLAEVSRQPSDYLTVGEVIEGWKVSERTLRRRLANGIPGSYQDRQGHWILPTWWVNVEFAPRGGRKKPKEPLTAETAKRLQGEAPDVIDLDESDTTIDLDEDPPEYVRALVETEHRATRAETQLQIALVQLEELNEQLKAALRDLDYERSLVQRLKSQNPDKPS